MKRAISFFLVLGIVLPLFAQNSLWFNGTFDQAKKQAITENKEVLIDFFSDG